MCNNLLRRSYAWTISIAWEDFKHKSLGLESKPYLIPVFFAYYFMDRLISYLRSNHCRIGKVPSLNGWSSKSIFSDFRLSLQLVSDCGDCSPMFSIFSMNSNNRFISSKFVQKAGPKTKHSSCNLQSTGHMKWWPFRMSVFLKRFEPEVWYRSFKCSSNIQSNCIKRKTTLFVHLLYNMPHKSLKKLVNSLKWLKLYANVSWKILYATWVMSDILNSL